MKKHLDMIDKWTCSNFWINMQGSHRLEKYLKMKGCLEKSLKNKFVLKSA